MECAYEKRYYCNIQNYLMIKKLSNHRIVLYNVYLVSCVGDEIITFSIGKEICHGRLHFGYIILRIKKLYYFVGKRITCSTVPKKQRGGTTLQNHTSWVINEGGVISSPPGIPNTLSRRLLDFRSEKKG